MGSEWSAFKRWLTNSKENWLLILDNADDPSLNVARYFPTNSRGTIIVTTRNPQCRSHSTVGAKEIGRMDRGEATTLLLKASDMTHTDEQSRRLAEPVVDMLGCLALAISHAGALIMNGICSLIDYCDLYIQSGGKILEEWPEGSQSSYEHTVYSTLDVSTKVMSKRDTETARNALDLLRVFGFFHFDDISEDIFKSAWRNIPKNKNFTWWISNQLRMLRNDQNKSWNPMAFRQAVSLLSSFSLVTLSGSHNKRISLHPLVHFWSRNSVAQNAQSWWLTSISTLSMASWYGRPSNAFGVKMQIAHHVKSCLALKPFDDLLVKDTFAPDRAAIIINILTLSEHNLMQDSDLNENVRRAELAVEWAKSVWGADNHWTDRFTFILVGNFLHMSEYQKALALLQKRVDLGTKTNTPYDAQTIVYMCQLSGIYNHLSHHEEALELGLEVLQSCDRFSCNRKKDYGSILATGHIAIAYAGLDRGEEAVRLLEEVLKSERLASLPHKHFLRTTMVCRLAYVYRECGRYQSAYESFRQALSECESLHGQNHGRTVIYMCNLATSHEDLGRSEDARQLLIKVVDITDKIGYGHLDFYRERLRDLELQRNSKANPVKEGEGRKRWKIALDIV